MKIGFLGLGRMGRELVGHLIDDGHDVTVWNRTASATTGFKQVAPTAAEAVRGADVVLTVLFGPDAVGEVVVDGDLPFDDRALWVDVTSVGPADAARFAGWAAGAGVRYVHSPVIGSLGPAKAGELAVVLGGAADDVAEALPLVSRWADPDRILVYDDPAHAAAAKLIANLSLAVAMQGLAEALRLGAGAGMDTGQVLAVTGLAKTPLSAITGQKGDTIRQGNYADTQFSVDLLLKDIRLMVRTADGPVPALTSAYASLEAAREAGNGAADFSIIAR
jgi:3-hydroxyisobutyrate dehydrogenase